MLLNRLKLEDDEKVLIQTRRHWFVIVSQISALVLMALAPPLLLGLGSLVIGENTTGIGLQNLGGFMSFMYFLYLSFIWIGIFGLYTNYFLDLLIITDRRIILINHKGFFWRNMASFRLERMQDINIEVSGVISTMLNFGTIEIETAGHSNEDFHATGIPNPDQLKALILQASDSRLKQVITHQVVAE